MKYISVGLLIFFLRISFLSAQNSSENIYKESYSLQPDQENDSEDKSALLQMIEDRNYPNNKNNFGRYEEEMVNYKSRPHQQLVANWTYVDASGNLNGDVGRTSSITFDTLRPGRFYVCAPHSGVWLTHNDGISYSPITESLPTQNTSCLVLDPADTNHLFVATGANNLDLPKNSMGIFETLDGGTTWNTTGLTFPASASVNIGDMIMNPLNHNSLLTATTDGLYRTFDSGVSWTKILNDSASSVRYKPGDTTIVYVIGKRFYRSVNSGNNFTQISANIFDQFDFSYDYFVRTSKAEPNSVYVITSGANNPNFVIRLCVHKSTDNGQTFTLTDTLIGEVDCQFDVSQLNADKFALGYRRTWMKQNSSSPFVQVTQFYNGGPFPYMHADQRGIFFDPHNDSIIYYCNDGGLYRTSDNGTSFQNITANMQLAHLYTFDQSRDSINKILVSPLDVSPYIIGNNGISRTFSQFVESFTSAMSPVNDSVFMIAHQTPTFSSDDWNNFYTSTHPLIGNLTFSAHDFFYSECNENVSYFGSYDDIFRSTDYSHNYTYPQHTTYNGLFNYIRNPKGIVVPRHNPDYVYVLYIDSVYLIKNSVQCINITAGLPVDSAAISDLANDPLNENRIWISFSGYSAGNKVFYSDDAGQHWTNVSTGIPNVPVNTIVCQKGIPGAMYAGTDGGVFYTEPGFSSWQYFNTGLPNVMVTELNINEKLGKIRAATFGRGVWESDLYQPTPANYLLPPVALFTEAKDISCAGDTITFYNTSCGTVDSIRWLFPGGIPATSTDQAPVVEYNTPGNFSTTLIAYNSSGSDTLIKDSVITIRTPLTIPYYEPVGDINVYQLPDGAITTDVNNDNISWRRELSSGASGPDDELIYYDNYSYPLNGSEEKFVLPSVNLSTAVHPVLYFYRAYVLQNNLLNDTLVVHARACGETDSILFRKGGSQLATVAGFFPNPYWPPAPSDWVRDSVDLILYAGKSDVSISFGNIGYGGQIQFIDEFLIDDINSPVSVQQIKTNDILIYPNPVSDQIFVRIKNNSKGEFYLSDIFGHNIKTGNFDRGNITINTSNLANGIYFLRVGAEVFKVEKY